MDRPWIIDGHLDLSMNAMQWNRDLRMPLQQIRRLEKHLSDKPDRGKGTVSFSEMKKGNIRFCIATLIARYTKPTHPLGGNNSPAQAWATVQGQLAWYEEMIRQGELQMVTDPDEFLNFIDQWRPGNIGFLLSLEGADSIITFEHLDKLFERGLRAIGPAHYGPGTYAYGTDSEGSIGQKGKELLQKMDQLGIALDVTHLCDTSFWEAIEIFKGVIWASHNNTRKIVHHQRQFSDDQLKVLIERKAVIASVLDAWMLVPNWRRGISTPESTGVSLSNVIDHIDHICQLAGNADHVAIGSDLDGGYGTEQCPSDVHSIADLQKIVPLLAERGYQDAEINQILHGNWHKIILRALKQSQ